jgi:hypothetical protein
MCVRALSNVNISERVERVRAARHPSRLSLWRGFFIDEIEAWDGKQAGFPSDDQYSDVRPRSGDECHAG